MLRSRSNTRALYSKIIHPKHANTSPSNQCLAWELTLQLQANSGTGIFSHDCQKSSRKLQSYFTFSMQYSCCAQRFSSAGGSDCLSSTSHSFPNFKSLEQAARQAFPIQLLFAVMLVTHCRCPQGFLSLPSATY